MNVLTLISTIILIFSFILVGLPVKYNCIGLNIAIILIGIILAGYKLFFKKEKFTITKTDLLVLLFCIVPTLPVIFKTYYSLEDTLILLVRNFSLFNVFFIVKETIGKNSDNSADLISALIVGGIILAILGLLEKFESPFFYQFLEIIKAQKMDNVSGRMVSALGYPNAFAIIMIVDLLLCINRFKENKIIYSILIVLFGICFISAFSRFAIMLLLAVMFIYIIFIKKMRKHLAKVGIALGFIVLFIVVAVNFKKPLEMTNNTKDSVTATIYNVEKNKEYTFAFDLTSESEDENAIAYKINIKERNKYEDITYSHELNLKNESGKKEIKFVTDEDTAKIEITVKNSNTKVKSKLRINSATVNGKKYALAYKFLPFRFIETIRDFRIDDTSVIERVAFITDGFKIAMNHFLIGAGGNGWYYEYRDIQSYNYATLESHSFLTETFIETGIIGFISLISILVILAVKQYKNIKKIDLMDVAFILLTLHSFIDFDMSFYCINVLWIALLSILNSKYDNIGRKKTKNAEKNNNMENIIFVVIILVNIFGVAMGIKQTNVEKRNTSLLETIDELNTVGNENKIVDLIREYEEYEETEDFYFKFKELDYSKINDENMQFIYEKLQERKIRVYSLYNIEKNEVLKQILETSQNEYWCLKVSDMIISENENYITNIKDSSKNRLSKYDIDNYLNIQDTIYKLAQERRKQFVGEQ